MSPESKDCDQLRQTDSPKESASNTASEDGEVIRSLSRSPAQVSSEAPPLPAEDVPPLPAEVIPDEDDGWDPVWDENAQAFYFYNRFTQVSQWSNPRIPDATEQLALPGVGNHDRMPDHAPGTEPPLQQQNEEPPQPALNRGYNPAIHGDYDPNAAYAKDPSIEPNVDPSNPTADPDNIYSATGTFNRFTGKWQPSSINAENHNDENKSKRQMSAFFDVDAAANSHNGKSLKAERAGKKLSKQELKAFKEKRKERKEEKRRAWLRD